MSKAHSSIFSPVFGSESRAIVLFSGGQDSATCLAWALSHFGYIETLGFHYRQRHAVELECRQFFLQGLSAVFPETESQLGMDHVLDIPTFQDIGETSLTSTSEIFYNEQGLPTTFVPARNLIFLSFAASLAYRRSLTHIVLGVCETDYSGYPDCRDDTIKAMQVALNLGLGTRLVLHTPLMWHDKAATFSLAYELGGAALENLILEYTHTCYLGDRNQRHEWGYGCGACPACQLRKNGFYTYKKNDKKIF
jgi:7-cyano-7-deazaguanine synthase